MRVVKLAKNWYHFSVKMIVRFYYYGYGYHHHAHYHYWLTNSNQTHISFGDIPIIPLHCIQSDVIVSFCQTCRVIFWTDPMMYVLHWITLYIWSFLLFLHWIIHNSIFNHVFLLLIWFDLIWFESFKLQIDHWYRLHQNVLIIYMIIILWWFTLMAWLIWWFDYQQ